MAGCSACRPHVGAVAQWQRTGLSHRRPSADPSALRIRDEAARSHRTWGGTSSRPFFRRTASGLPYYSGSERAVKRISVQGGAALRVCDPPSLRCEPRLGCLRHSGGAGHRRCDAMQSRGGRAGAAGEGRRPEKPCSGLKSCPAETRCCSRSPTWTGEPARCGTRPGSWCSRCARASARRCSREAATRASSAPVI